MRRRNQEGPLMRIYIIGNDGITLCRKGPATVDEGEIAIASKEELHAARLSGKRLLALWNALPGVDKRIGQRERLEFLGLGVEAQDGIRTPVADPYRIIPVNIDGIGLRPVARQMPASPTAGLAVVTEQIAAVPSRDPQPAAAIA